VFYEDYRKHVQLLVNLYDKKTRRFGFPPLVYNFAKERTKHAWKAKDSDGF
jgi:hypothetical protein